MRSWMIYFRAKMHLVCVAVVLLVFCTPLCVGQQPCADNTTACQTPIYNLTLPVSPVSLTVSSTCGDPNNTVYSYPDTPNTDVTCSLGMHPKELMLDTETVTFGGTYSVVNPKLSTYWQSRNTITDIGAPPTQPEFVILNSTVSFLIRTVVITFISPGNSSTDMRPRAMQIAGWNNDTLSWVTWRLYADNCSVRYPGYTVSTSNSPQIAQQAYCMEKFYAGDSSTALGIGLGIQQVSFRPSEEFPDFGSNPSVQRQFLASAVRLQLDYPAKDTPKLSYYAVADLAMEWQCSCYGHASTCNPATGLCNCGHNTVGDHCEQCLPLFNNRPWQMGVVGSNQSSVCQDCNCGGYSASCHYDLFAGNGICDGCLNNTAGYKCESCVTYYYVNPSQNASAPNALCTGVLPPTFQPFPYNCSSRCIPCNCSSIGTDPAYAGQCEGNSGNCTCKQNVRGRACDACKDGFWNLDASNVFYGCTACDCEPSGSLNSISFCDYFNGTCICKNFTEGTRCERCKMGYFDIDISKPGGCSPCDCDVGASQSMLCPAIGGTCICKTSVAGRSCRQPYDGFFGPVLDFLTFEAEFSPNVSASDIVERYGAGDYNATNTGRGFVNMTSQRSLPMTISVPFMSLFTVIVRYETNASWPGVQVIFQLRNPSNAPYSCGTSTQYQARQQFTADMPAKVVAGAVAFGTTCLLAGALYDVQLNFPLSNPPNSRILIDSVVLIPDLNTSNAYSLSNDSMKVQMQQCGRILQSVDVSMAQNLSCPQLGYSIMVDKFSGAVDCACNTSGSLNTICNPIGGQCVCMPNVFLRDCSQCKVNSYGYASGQGCTECLCDPNGSVKSACDANGICSCKTNVVGDKCDTCIPLYWGVFTGNGCQPCQCNAIYAVNNSCIDSGQCYCQPGFAGISCDRCGDGFYLPTPTGCTWCGCSFYGSRTINCDPADGHCTCKNLTVGFTCNTCLDGYYGLGPWGDEGCIRCYCSGHSNNCSSAFGWYEVSINTTLDLKDGSVVRTNEWTGVDQAGNDVPVSNPTLIVLDGPAVHVMTINNDLNGTLFYFVAPDVYIGDKRSAYGHNFTIELVVTFPPTLNGTLVPVPADGDVFIQGNYTSFTLVTSLPSAPGFLTATTYSLRLHESIWYLNSSTSATKVRATYEQMIQVLASIKTIRIRATYFQFTGIPTNETILQTSLVTTILTFATSVAPTSPDQVLVNNVEQCICPPQYQGQFCEFCAPGYTRMTPSGGMFSPCVRCFCNNHEVQGTICDAETGACNCTDSTTGIHCDVCLDGFYGYPASGQADSCQPCMCPGNVVANDVNAFASTCHNDGSGGYVCDNCTGGSTGIHCDTCANGYYGTPMNTTNNAIGCISCSDPDYCYGNAGYNQTCNNVTGECLNCGFNTTGRHCETCLINFYGTGTLRNCQPCICNTSRGMTGDCDKAIGTCFCKDGVTSTFASACDICMYGYFNYSSTGCQACNCFVPGSPSVYSCDQANGSCTCNPGYMGKQCDTCVPGKRFPTTGCSDCGCRLGDGSTNSSICDPLTGQCPCNPGFAGALCEVCQAGKNGSLPYIHSLSLGSFPSCVACDSCYDNIASQVSQLGVNMENSFDQILNLWLTSYRNGNLDDITAQVQIIYNNVSTAVMHKDLLKLLFPLFQHFQENYTQLGVEYSRYVLKVNTNSILILFFRGSLQNIMLWTGNVQVAPSVTYSPSSLSAALLSLRLDQDSKFNYSRSLYLDISNRIGIITNVNGTIDGLRLRVRVALSLVANSQAARTSAERLLNLSSTSILTDENLLFHVSDQINSLLILNASVQGFVNEALYYQNLANNLQIQMSNMSLSNDVAIYNRTRDAQMLKDSATAAQSLANGSLTGTNQFLNSATSAKQSISANVITLAGALKTAIQVRSNLDSGFQTANTILAMLLDTQTFRINDLVQQINNTVVPLDKVNSINSMASQSLQLASAAQNSTQADLLKAQRVLGLLNAIQSNLTQAQILQQTAQAGWTNASNSISFINSVIFTVSQKASSALALAAQTDANISSIEVYMNSLQQTYPTITSRLRAARAIAEFENRTANDLIGAVARNLNASNTLQVGIDAKTLLLNQQKSSLQFIKTELDSVIKELNDVITYYNLLGVKQEADQQVQDIRSLNNDVSIMSVRLDQLRVQLDALPPNTTYCIATF